MEELKELWAQVQPVLCSTPVILVLAAAVGVSAVKKLVKLAITLGAIVLLLLVLRHFGVGLDDVQKVAQEAIGRAGIL